MKLRNTLLGIPAGQVWLDGHLAHAPDVRGLALVLRPYAPSSGHTQDAHVTGILQASGFATLVLNLLTRHEEARDPDARFNVPQLANRVLAAAEWISRQPPLAALQIGVVASGTASGAAIRAGWKAPERFAAIVCRGGRPDLAGATPLGALTVPIRFVVAAEDPELPIITRAYEHIRAPRDWHTVERAGDAFLEPGALPHFARLATDWLVAKMPPAPAFEADGEPTSGEPVAPRGA